MKDQDFFLNTKFTFDKVNEHLFHLLSNGWIIRVLFVGQNVKVKIWEDAQAKKEKEFMVETNGSGLHIAMVNAFEEIQNYYKRVLA